MNINQLNDNLVKFITKISGHQWSNIGQCPVMPGRLISPKTAFPSKALFQKKTKKGAYMVCIQKCKTAETAIAYIGDAPRFFSGIVWGNINRMMQQPHKQSNRLPCHIVHVIVLLGFKM